MAKAQIGTSILALTLIMSACLEDGERGNPLDPLSSNFVDEGQVSGRVTQRSLAGVSGSLVQLTPGGLTSVTDGSGSFSISDVPSGSYTVTVEAAGYVNAVDTISVAPGVPVAANFELNGLPILESWTVNTAHISRWWPLEDLFQVEFVVQASDIDGVFDVDKVWLDIPDYGFADTLLTTQTTGTFARTLNDLDLPTTTIHALLGRPMLLSVRDHLSDIVTTPDLRLVRIIDETPEAVEEAFQNGPQDCLQGQSGSGVVPLIEWKPLFLPYPFTHRVDIIRVDSGLETLVERIDNIPFDETSVVATPLPDGEYYWTVAVVDEFMNRSRSKQVGFCIIP